MYVESISMTSGYCSAPLPIGERQVSRTSHNPFIQEHLQGRTILVPVESSKHLVRAALRGRLGSCSYTQVQVMLQPHCTLSIMLQLQISISKPDSKGTICIIAIVCLSRVLQKLSWVPVDVRNLSNQDELKY